MKKINTLIRAAIAVSVCLFVSASGFSTKSNTSTKGWSLCFSPFKSDVRWSGPILVTGACIPAVKSQEIAPGKSSSQKNNAHEQGWGLRPNTSKPDVRWSGPILVYQVTNLPEAAHEQVMTRWMPCAALRSCHTTTCCRMPGTF